MSEIFSKLELNHMVDSMVDELRECEDGSVMSTSGMLASFGYNTKEFDISDLLYLDGELRKVAKLNHIKLDRSAYDGMEVGLPFNFGTVVRNKSAQIKCPYCGGNSTARILYGMPSFSEELEKKIADGKVSIGGCKLMGVEIDGEFVETNPKRICNTCQKTFASPPLLIAKDWSTAEDYRDIVQSIRFSVSDDSQGKTEVTITRNDKGALVKVIKYPCNDGTPAVLQIIGNRWDRILYALYCQLYLHEWKKSYDNPQIQGGTQWRLEIKLTNRRKRIYSGSNAYPPYWKELQIVFQPFVRISDLRNYSE